jgi:hypothetical protein
VKIRDGKRQAMRCDAALSALELTLSLAVAQAAERREPEKSAPELWRKLPEWAREKQMPL